MFIVNCIACNSTVYFKSEYSARKSGWRHRIRKPLKMNWWYCPYCLGTKKRKESSHQFIPHYFRAKDRETM